MIDHLALYEIEKLTDRFGLGAGVPKGVKPRYNIVPASKTPVVVHSGTKTELVSMRWGLVTEGAKDFNAIFRYKTFNIMAEKVFSKATWDKAVHERRCIIPVNGFYMVRADDAGEAYFFNDPEGSLMALAGVYTPGSDPDDPNQRTFTLLTTESNETMPLPFKRMPLVLRKENESIWIDRSVTDLSSIIRAMEPSAGTLAYRKVSADIKSLKVDSKDLLSSIEY
jgi:putative SOS response-associated peptidase YedK